MSGGGIDPLGLLNQQMGGFAHGGPATEVMHRDEPTNLDEFALESIGKPIPRKAANYLSANGLIKLPPSARRATPRRPAPRQHVPDTLSFDDDMVYAQDIAPAASRDELLELESKNAFLTEKLALCEALLQPDQIQAYQQAWMAKVMEAAGDNFMSAVGMGFLQKKQEAVKPPEPEQQPEEALPQDDPMLLGVQNDDIEPFEEIEEADEQSIRGLFERDEAVSGDQGTGDPDLGSGD